MYNTTHIFFFITCTYKFASNDEKLARCNDNVVVDNNNINIIIENYDNLLLRDDFK